MKTNLELVRLLRKGHALYNPFFGTILVWAPRGMPGHFYKYNPQTGTKVILTWEQVRGGLKQHYWEG